MEPYDPQSGATSTPSNWMSTGGLSRLLFIIVGIAALYGVYCLGQRQQPQSSHSLLADPISTATSNPTTSPPVMVHVVGRVAHPGVYRLPSNARVIDAIDKAGGPLPDADTDAINLAAWIEDGTRIEVPTKAKSMPKVTTLAPRIQTQSSHEPNDTEAAGLPEKEPSPPQHYTPISSSTPTTTARPKSSTTRASTASSRRKSKHYPPEYLQKHPVNLNTATVAQLETLPGIGPVTAAKIIAYREENGKFVTVDDLDEVKGIGEKKLEKLRPLVTVN